ncbi:acyltransferase domain-containing protein, partial [Streptomyces sp. NPDC051567]|uniref:acyltransferase domain-containing protein n=1 Tax=Streptomyces sp. NPDC051567 TaxID=3365660 RepID=UPI00379960CC
GDLLRLTALRGRLMEAGPQEGPLAGAMAVAHIDADAVREALVGYPGVEIAAFNAPRSVTVSGPATVVDAFCAGVSFRTQRLTVSHAFHSAAMEGAVAPFAEAVAATRLQAPGIPFASTATGDWHTAATATDPRVWAEAIRRPVLFTQALARVGEAGGKVFWEVGPHPVLTTLGRSTLTGDSLAWHHTLRRDHSDQGELHKGVAAHYSAGDTDIDWAAVHAGKGQRVMTIPTYPFDRQRFWVGNPNQAQ